MSYSSDRANLDRDAGRVVDITIVGAGPVGLCAAFWAGMRGASCRVVDALGEVGGQCSALYPEKWIFDVPGHPRVVARELVARLRAQSVDTFDVPVHLETTAEQIAWEHDAEGQVVVVHTSRGPLRSRAVILAGGHGAFEPRRLPPADADVGPWEARGAHYVVRDKSEFAGKRVIIVGGGDSACDWVITLLDQAGAVALVHRRSEFRAHEATVAEVRAAAAEGRAQLHAPYVVRQIEGRERIQSVVLHRADGGGDPIRLPCDALLLQLGFTTKLGPLKTWGFELDRNAVVVDRTCRTRVDNVWACGDIATFDGKIKLIATGFGEAATAIGQAVRSFRPEMKLQPAYSTNTGVPTAEART